MSTTTTTKNTKLPNQPLPLSDILQDLAVLRATSISVKNLVNPTASEDSSNSKAQAPEDVEKSVASSYDFVQSARAAIKLHDSEKLATQESKLDEIRNRYEGLVQGISGSKNN